MKTVHFHLLCALLFLVLTSVSARPSNDDFRSGDCAGQTCLHGKCMEGFCVCSDGFIGAHCDRPFSNWKRIHSLEHSFYESDAFKSRYVLAAHHLKGCSRVTEIGAYRTPITDFLAPDSGVSEVVVLDPYVAPAYKTVGGMRVWHLPRLFQEHIANDYGGKAITSNSCLVVMGLDPYDEDDRDTCSEFVPFAARFSKVVIDFAAMYPKGVKCWQSLEQAGHFDQKLHVLLEVGDNVFPSDGNSWSPKGLTRRSFRVLENKLIDKSDESVDAYPESTVPIFQANVRTDRLPVHPSSSSDHLSSSGDPMGRDEPSGKPKEQSDDEFVVNAARHNAGPAAIRSREQHDFWFPPGGVKNQPQPSTHSPVPPKEEIEVNVRSEEDAKQAFFQSNKMLRAEKYSSALSLLKAAKKFAPDFFGIYNNEGLAHEGAGHIQEALDAYVTGIQRNPNSMELHFNLGRLLIALEKVDMAEQHLRKAVDLRPGEKEALFYLATVLLDQNKELDLVEKLFSRVRAIDPEYQIQFINSHTNVNYEVDIKQEIDALDKVILADCSSEGRSVQSCCEGIPSSIVTSMLKNVNSAQVSLARSCKLKQVVRHLRDFEGSFEFVSRRQVDGMRAQIKTGYMKHNFAYGATFFQSWQAIASTRSVTGALGSLNKRDLQVGVFGSSLGWHAFFTSLSEGVRAKGWEILCSQVQKSKEVAELYGISDITEFHCADALAADISDVGLLVLAFSRDVNLGQKLNDKMAQELPQGAVVIAWSGILSNHPSFVEDHIVEVAVSWQDTWAIHIHHKL